MDQLTISATKLAAVFNYFENIGFKKKNVLNDLGINPSILESPDNRFTAQEVNLIFKKAADLSDSVSIGLHMGAGLSKGFSNILGYLLMNCVTLAEASQMYSKYERIVDETSVTETATDAINAIVSINILDVNLLKNRQFSEYKSAGLLSYIKLLTGRAISLKEVHFTHENPKDISEYTEIFKCPVYFKRETNSLIFDKSLLNLPIIEPNISLLQVFEEKARETMEKLKINKTYSDKVAKTILKEIHNKIPSVKNVASSLNLSVRSLQSCLQREGTSYTEILNDTRKYISIHCLQDRNVSIDEIAFITGFSEASSFQRAFKKWTGLTPGKYRISQKNVNMFTNAVF